MKTASKLIAQGDVLFRRVPSIPAGFVEAKRIGDIVVSHSETGHKHAIHDRHVTMFEDPKSALVCYLRMDIGVEELGGCDVVHHRSFDTHETVRLLGKPGDVWEVRRQREWTPEGWRAAVD